MLAVRVVHVLIDFMDSGLLGEDRQELESLSNRWAATFALP